jgi:mannose-6-phosphate isomerase
VLPLYPLTFQPRFKERVWGGRRLQTLYGKNLPPNVPIGESWEISDRPGDESVIANGPLAGLTLRDLMDQRGADVLGAAAPAPDGRFPLLCKLLDARQTLSLQVHPPDRAAHLGDPKTEMWYIADAGPGAELFVGLKRGVTREAFERALAAGRVAECFHRVDVKRGDAMLLPSGRVHAIGANLVIFEIQQNSDTTFRVYDWDRVGLDGKPRELHIPQSLESIDFDDFEPGLVDAAKRRDAGFAITPLVDTPLFRTDLFEATGAVEWRPPAAQLRAVACVGGRVTVRGGGASATLRAGSFCLLPARMADVSVDAPAGAAFLLTEPR